MRTRLFLALAVLVLGLLWQMRVCGCSPPMVERASISIRKVHHGTLQIPLRAGGTFAPAESHTNVGVEFAQVETADYAEKGGFDQRYTEMNVFRVEPDGKTARQVPVRFRVVTPDLIGIKEGLQEGDQVIVSDMSRWSNVERVWFE